MDKEAKILEARSLINDGKLEEAEKIIAEIRALDSDKKEESKKEDTNKEQEAEKEQEAKKEDPKDEAKKEDKEQESKDKKEEPEKKEERSAKIEGEIKQMEKVILDGKEQNVEKTEERSFLDYVRSRDVSTRAFDTTGVKSADASAIIPEEIITKARKLPETVVDLRSKVTVQNVSHASGTYPILKPNKAILVSVEELKANPDLDKPQFDDVDYKVLTYRGQLAVAQEALDDSDDNLGGIIANHIQRQALNTANAKLGALLRTAQAVAATSLDDIKTQINTGFDPAYGLELLVSQSFYNEVDKMKDGEGRYLLQPTVAAGTGKSLFGVPVTVLADDLIGTAKGDKVAFLGDPRAFAVYFNRLSYTARWVEEVYYGQVLAVGMRFDAKVVDPAAGKFITLTPAVTP